MIEKVLTGDDVEIANLYKTGSHAPYTPLEKGNFGYLGVLLSRKSDGKVQCHVCGKWFDFLSKHITSTHKEFKTLAQYKRKFGFPILFPICSQKYSSSQREGSSTAERMLRIRKLGKNGVFTKQTKRSVWRKKALRHSAQAANTPSRLNTLDICRDQTIRRVEVVKKHLGRFPSAAELMKFDSNIWEAIRRRYGTWNKFKSREFKDEPLLLPKPLLKYTDDYMLFLLREFRRKNGRNPTSGNHGDFRNATPSLSIYYKRFGSWSRALSLAGLQVNPKETKTYRKAG